MRDLVSDREPELEDQQISVRVVGRPDVFADAVPQAVDLVAGFLCDAVEDEVLLC